MTAAPDNSEGGPIAGAQRASQGLSQGSGLSPETVQGSFLYNEDLAPVASERRSWSTYNYAALWIAMSVNIPTYMLASGMIAGGMNWKQAIFTVFLGNVLVLIPMLLNAHAGAVPASSRSSASALGARQGGRIRAHARVTVPIPHLRRILPFLHSVAYRRRGILGRGGAEHPRLHAVRSQPARADARPGAGLAHNDDVLLVYRHRGHFSHHRCVRRSHLGSGCRAQPAGKSAGGGCGDDRAVDGHAQRQCGRERCLARKRFLQSLPAAHQLPHGGSDDLRDRH